ncbi:MAG: hypothetical protein M1825_001437 [Sarcosagium campestre]|nr:MAG: hypothetical protein M1825_001437 [Sarcosagium campestre]
MVNQKLLNLWTARVVPIFLVAIVSYASWAFVKTLCVDRLLRPRPNLDRKPREGVAAALLVLYFLLLLPMAVTFGRLLFTVATNPGYVPRGPQYRQRAMRVKHGKRRVCMVGPDRSANIRTSGEKDGNAWTDRDDTIGISPYGESWEGARACESGTSPFVGLEQFYDTDVYFCDSNGFPIWCSTCLNYKPDRAHHCSEVSRCVRKMDHFCPWVGGIVSETNFKFFIQFVVYASVFWIYDLVVMTFYLAESAKESGPLNVHYIVVVAMAALFTFFTLGMSISSIQLALHNSTTIESFTRHTKVWYMAVRIPYDNEDMSEQALRATAKLPQLKYPLPSQMPLGAVGLENRKLPPLRRFVVLSTKPGENPFDLGMYRNWTEVMGPRPIDWLLPLKYSPCSRHENPESAFPLGPVVDRLRREHYLPQLPPPQKGAVEPVDAKARADAGAESDAEEEQVEPEGPPDAYTAALANAMKADADAGWGVNTDIDADADAAEYASGAGWTADTTSGADWGADAGWTAKSDVDKSAAGADWSADADADVGWGADPKAEAQTDWSADAGWAADAGVTKPPTVWSA